MAFINMYVKCYTLIFKEENTRRTFVTLKAQKNQANFDLEKAKKRINELESELQGTKKREEVAQKVVQDEQQKKEAVIQAIIEAESVCFLGEKKCADDA